jgi:hypothetical protein
MKIFISWSAERSKQVALALRDFLPIVLHYTEPWLSEIDIPAGERWSVELNRELEASSFGIICLTRENLQAPWILFEAGAIAKSLASSAVCPYLLDLDLKDISGPLAQFQAKKANRESTLEIVQSINQKAPKQVEPGPLLRLFDKFWPDLEAKLREVSKGDNNQENPIRPDNEILEDLVSVVRSIERRFQVLESNAEIIQPSHPIFRRIADLTNTSYRVYFSNTSELEQWLMAQQWNVKEYSWDGIPIVWQHEKESKSLKFVNDDIFDEQGELNPYTEKDWRDDWIELEDEDEIPF